MIDLDTWMGSVSRRGDAPSIVPLITPHLCSLSQASSVNAFTELEVFLQVTGTRSFDYALTGSAQDEASFPLSTSHLVLSEVAIRDAASRRLLMVNIAAARIPTVAFFSLDHTGYYIIQIGYDLS